MADIEVQPYRTEQPRSLNAPEPEPEPELERAPPHGPLELDQEPELNTTEPPAQDATEADVFILCINL